MLDYTYTFTWNNTGEQQNYGFIYALSVFISYKFHPTVKSRHQLELSFEEVLEKWIPIWLDLKSSLILWS